MNWTALIVGTAVAGFLGAAFEGFGQALAIGILAGLVVHQGKRLKELDALLTTLKRVREDQIQAQAPVVVAPPPPAPVPVPAPVPEPAPAPTLLPPPPPRLRPAPVIITSPDEHSPAVTSSLGASLLAWFRGGNTIVRVGVLILFIGVAFLLRYAAEHTRLPIELRLAGVALGGVVLTVLGLRLASKRRGYGLSLQGAGVGIVYLTLFAAYRLYELLPTGLAFGLLAAMAAITTVLALRQDALPLAALGFGGAFLAPVLTSTGQGSHIALFSYYLMLNIAIAGIARAKAWKLLNVEGFVFSFGIGAAWGFKAYGPEHFWSTEAFLLAHFALYLFITVQYTLRMVQAQEKQPGLPLVDGSLLFGTPIVAFGLQAALLHKQPMALAFSAAVLAGVYLLLGQMLWQRAGRQVLLLVEGMAALGLVFLALVTPLALDARWTSAAWAVQGLGVLWIALRQRRWWAVAMGLLLQLGAAMNFWFLSEWFLPGQGGTLLFFNSVFLSMALLAATALASARLLLRASREPGTPAPLATLLPQALMMALGLVQLWFGGGSELERWDQSRLDGATLICIWQLVLALACMAARAPLAWPQLRWPARLFSASALLISAAAVLDDASWARFTTGLGLLEALALIALGRWMLRHQDTADPPALNAAERLLSAWYAMLQGGCFLYLAGAHFVMRHEGWTPAAAILLPTLLALAVLLRAAPAHAALYRRGLLLPWLVALMLWVLAVNAFCDAGMAPLPYLPLLNPLDLAHGLVLVYALKLAPPPQLRLPAAGLAFWWLNALLVRTLHHWAGTPMWFDGALEAPMVQTGLSVLWTTSALVAMRYATRRAAPAQARQLWIAGAVLLGVVVLKLFLVDLSSLGSLMRIVSFLAVGALMLVIGYVAPLPPAAEEEKKT